MVTILACVANLCKCVAMPRSPYALNFGSLLAQDPQGEARRRKQAEDAGFWGSVGRVAPALLGTIGGGILGTVAGGPAGLLTGAGLGGTIGSGIGNAIGTGVDNYAQGLTDTDRERAIKRDAVLQAIMGMRR